MKTSIISILVLVLFWGNAEVSNAQNNLYPDSISGFEIDFWIGSNPQPADAYDISVVTDKKFDGTRAIKYDCPDASIPTGGHATAILGGTNASYQSGNIVVAKGDYVFSAKIFIEGTAPSNILVYFADKSEVITDGKILTIPLTNVQTGSWQTISQAVTFPADISEMKTGLRIRGIDYSGMTGSSTIYIDQIGLYNANEVPDTTKLIYSPILDPNCNWKMNNAYSDEFNESQLDQDKWDTDVQDWGTWSWEPENAYLKDTVLVLRMQQKETTRGGNTYYFTSGILQNKQEITYGYFEAKIKASAKGQGTCPAFWLYSFGLPAATENDQPQYCEIDAVEIFQVPNKYKHLEMNLHTRVLEDGSLVWKRPGTGYTELCHNEWDAPWDPRDEYHTYAVWNRVDSIFWYVDGVQRGAKKNYYWNLPMHVTVSMGLRTPYEKYIDGVRTAMYYPESNPEPGFPTEMYCDYVRVYNTPPQLYADKEKYDNAEFHTDSTLKFECRYFAGNGEKVLAENWGGVTCKLQELNPDGSVANEISLVDSTTIGNESGAADFNFSLKGLTPSDELPAGNKYVLKPVFKTSLNGGEDVYMKDQAYLIKILKSTTTSSISPASNASDQMFAIYPNPASNHLIFRIYKIRSNVVPVTFYNAQGKIVLRKMLKCSSNINVDISGLCKGLYLVKCLNETKKLVVN